MPNTWLSEVQTFLSRSGLQLPKDVSFRKERLSSGWSYVFRHISLGDLGRIVRKGRLDGRIHVAGEVAFEACNHMTDKGLG